MSGGIAYVLDRNQLFDTRCNLEMVDVEPLVEEEDRLAVHYVTGSTIIIHLKDGEIERMEVEGARGVHMEPIRRRGTNATSQEGRRGGNR